MYFNFQILDTKICKTQSQLKNKTKIRASQINN